jgi:CDGSH-type Zn-finger protein
MRLKPDIAGTEPVVMELQERTTYSFCPCGKSQKQPFCDGSHKEVTDFKSIKFTMLKTETVELCMCKHSKTLPFCDGSHKACGKKDNLLGALLRRIRRR